MALSDILRARQAQKKTEINWKKEAEFLRAKFKREEMLRKEEKEREKKRRIQEDEERRRLKKLADDEAERIHKTKEYFQLDRLMRKHPEEGNPKYYGDNIASIHGTWIPHGDGSLFFEDKKFFEGKWVKGTMHGKAIFTHEDGSIWEGNFRMGAIHGVGYLTVNDKREEVLAYNNVIHCYRSELYDGKQVEINDPTLRIGNSSRPRVTLMSHRKGWSFKCRFHDEVHPRERFVDFSTLKSFKVLHHLPLVYDMTRFDVPTEADVRYNYWNDVFGQPTRPKLGHAGGRFTASMKPKGVYIKTPEEKAKSEYDENIFESQEMGIGKTLMKLEKERVAAEKLAAWNKSLAEKRELEEAKRNEMVEKEEARVMAEAQAAQLEKKQQHRAEEEARLAQVKRENEKWDKRDNARGQLEASRALSRERSKRESQQFLQTFALEPLSKDAHVQPNARCLAADSPHQMESALAVMKYKESKLTTKAIRTLPRIQSRYAGNRYNYFGQSSSISELWTVKLIRTIVKFTYYDDYLGSSAESTAAFIGFSLDSEMTDNTKNSMSVLPLKDEETRIYIYDNLSGISFEMSDRQLSADTLEVFLFEDKRGQEPSKIGSAFFDFDVIKSKVGDEVEFVGPFHDGDDELGSIQVTITLTPLHV